MGAEGSPWRRKSPSVRTVVSVLTTGESHVLHAEGWPNQTDVSNGSVWLPCGEEVRGAKASDIRPMERLLRSLGKKWWWFGLGRSS